MRKEKGSAPMIRGKLGDSGVVLLFLIRCSGWWFQTFLCSSLFGEMIQFD